MVVAEVVGRSWERMVTVPGVREVLDGSAMVQWGRLCLVGLERHRDEINALNVFPVADADTGTNLLATMRAAVTAAQDALSAPARSHPPTEPESPAAGSDPGDSARTDGGTSLNDHPRRSEPGHGAVGDDCPGRVSAPGGDAVVDGDARDENADRAESGGGDQLDGVAGDSGRSDVVRSDVVRGDVLDRDESTGGDAGSVLAAMARAGTAGARGNSGIILSQVLRGLAEAVGSGPLTARNLRAALRRAAVLVRRALSRPVEGTMLSVLEAAADRAADCPDAGLAEVARTAADGAFKALGDTPSQLGVLRAAGVVDAGARGLSVVLDALVGAITGQVPMRQEYRSDIVFRTSGFAVRQANQPSVVHHVPELAVWQEYRTGTEAHVPGSAAQHDDQLGTVRDNPESEARQGYWSGGVRDVPESPARQEYRSGIVRDVPESARRHVDRSAPVDDLPESAVRHEYSAAGESAQYEVMYLLSGTTETRIGELREHLARLGDSVVVVGDGADGWSAHVHCADAGAAVEAGLAAGTLSRIRIEGLTANPLAAQGPPDRGIIAVAAGAGAARLFEDSGATVLDGEVTAEVLLAAIRRMPQREVLVLPNGALAAHELVAVGMAARAGATPREVLMLPSGSMVQGLAALAVHDGGRIAVDDAFAMSEAAAGTRWGALRIARERALTIVGTCARGDGLGLVGNDVVVIDPQPRAAARTLLDRMLGLGGELVTLLLGADAPRELAEDLAEHITATFPGVEVVAYTGGQPLDIVQIGVE